MTIGEISDKTNLPESTLRYYEKKQLLRVSRDKNSRRNYMESDIEWIKFICRLKETGMLLKDIKRFSELRYTGDSTIPERLKILQSHRDYVSEQQNKWTEYIQNLDGKIEFYNQSIEIKKEKRQL